MFALEHPRLEAAIPLPARPSRRRKGGLFGLQLQKKTGDNPTIAAFIFGYQASDFNH
ncbi:conserved hypothetical protein (plasmid) [Rhizobium rhizogenes K84]|uniref:Uncharacterized protein n=1 Tax=Rhizobium rhizogenes (strain K84 / ATCC BAA-868) TaxID=311403 RepID=B9JPQ8_RHIR8|nr:conserved hypothetical protein [Rhizobium rhizogenes K84]